MGDSGYHMEAQRKARMLKKKNEAMTRIQELQQGNFNTFTYNPTVGDCLQMQHNERDQYNSMNWTNRNSESSYRSASAAAYQQQQQLPLLAVGQTSSRSSSSSSTPIFSSRLSTERLPSGLRSATPVMQGGGLFQTPSPSFGRPMSGGGFSVGPTPTPPQPQTPGLEELLGQQRSVYSTDLFPEYEDDRELFDTFTYI